ncbi:GSCFA domain-containing protein [Tenacibaculum geojense]|uniref:GSCFA domain-containing protein n=1 Tax=Tenacibaculum geojense TaxID=915352 RepID=A0ABW3JSH5_9FLAO
MQLFTQVPIKKQQHHLINYDAKLLLLGSCFSENIGQKLEYFKFQTYQNPFGILFHPKAIETLILNSINTKEYNSDAIFLNNNVWHSFEAHSSLSNIDKNSLLDSLNNAVIKTHKQLISASHIIITLGTAWVYRHIASDKIVANCHKVPQKKFLKELLSVEAISESIENCITLIKSVNPKASVIFTVSPVRHIKDGFIENQQSKAHLLTAIHQQINNRKQLFYFPSYEIMMDELRDYRFYNEDMIHPNTTAINYIWDKFTATWFSNNTYETMKLVDSLQKGFAHKPFNPETPEHQKFLDNLHKKKETLLKAFPFMNF